MDDLAIRERESSFVIQAADLSKNDLPSLEDAQELPIDLCGNYWTPEKPGEFRKMYFVEIKPQKVLSATSPDELIDLDCATFLEQMVRCRRLQMALVDWLVFLNSILRTDHLKVACLLK